MSLSQSSALNLHQDLAFELLRVRANFNVDNSGGQSESVRWRFPPLKGTLERNQVAELVAYMPTKHNIFLDDLPDVANASLDASVSWWEGGHTADTDSVAEDLNDFTDGYTTNTSTASLNYRILHETKLVYQGHNSNGGTLMYNSTPGGNIHNMREEFGQGPIVFPDEFISNGTDFTFTGLDTRTVHFGAQLMCWWDVWERDEVEYHDTAPNVREYSD